jgi:hypothetical protein
MGQRSQIYIRYNNKTGVQLIARYFGWNYGERMVSRARGIIEWLDSRKQWFDYLFDSVSNVKELERICDVNFDMRDVMISSDILQEIRDEFSEEAEKDGANKWIFGQDNNDGQLLIDVCSGEIKYAFIPYFDELNKVMDADAYMKYNVGSNWKTKNWQTPNEPDDQDAKEYTIKNIEYISKAAKLMTSDEVKEFVGYDYSFAVFGYPF